MLSWVKSWFAGEDRLDVYHPKERLIFSYWDGSKTIKADPLGLYKRLMAVGVELSINMKVAASASKDNASHHEKMLDKIADVFGVRRAKVLAVGDGGMMDGELSDLFDRFMLFTERLKKNWSLSPTPSTPSVVSKTTSPDGPPTGNSSASGSTAAASSTDAPEPSPSVPA